MNDILIRPAQSEELKTLYFLSNISNIQKNYPSTEINLEVLSEAYSIEQNCFEESFKNPREILLVAEAPDFKSKYPLFGSNGKQICGYSSGIFHDPEIYNIFAINGFYAVKSPYLTGLTMMQHLLTTVSQPSVEAIKLYTKHPNSALWYSKNALFVYEDKEIKPGSMGDMILFKENFAAAQQKITDTLALKLHKAV